MTNRTVSLLLLFVIGLGVTGILLAVFVNAFGSSAASPWLAPVIAAACATMVLHLGRQYILPRELVYQTTRAGLTLAVLVSFALAAAAASVWVVQWSVGRYVALPSAIVPLWFAFLWLLVQRQHARGRSLA